MEGQLTIGTEFKSECGNKYKVVEYLGAGGQGEVYKVSCGASEYALKWYFIGSATEAQKKILDKLIEKGSPTRNEVEDVFLWPKDLIYEGPGKLGYIMDLRPEEYKGIVDLMKYRVKPSFDMLITACFNLAKGYLKLHEEGYQYRDISFGNAFFNPNNGSVRICDNDNVTPNGAKEGGVWGTPRFMAPEIVRRDPNVRPSRNTDRFSLAVLLFYMLMINHPLEGAQEAKIKCLDPAAMLQLYGKNPIFIFDPNNDTNRPVPGYQDNAKIFWDIYPKYIKDLFIQSFTDGLNTPGKRVTENQWYDALVRLRSGIIECQSCKQQNFYDSEKSKDEHICWNCKKKITVGTQLVIGKGKKQVRVPTYPNTKLYSHHINGDYDMNTVVGEVVAHPSDPTRWGIRNKTTTNWTYKKADGSQIAVANEKTAGIAKNVAIDFGKVEGTFE